MSVLPSRPITITAPHNAAQVDGQGTGRFPRRRMLTALVAALLLGAIAAGVFVGRRPGPSERFQAAWTALERRDLNRAAAELRVLSRRPGFEAHAQLLRAGLALWSGDPESALKMIADFRPAGELRVPATMVAGESLYHLGRLDEAQMLFSRLAAEQPRLVAARRWRAAIAYDLGELREAIDELERLLELAPGDWAAHRMLGRIYQQDLHQYEPATRNLRRALEGNPPEGARQELLVALARSLIEQADYEHAVDALESADDDVEVLSQRAECCWNLGRRGEARAILTRARNIDAGSRDVLMLESRWDLEENEPGAAIGKLREILDRDPHDFPCRYQIALAFQRLGDRAASRNELRRMQESRAFRDNLAELSVQVERLGDPAVREQIADLFRGAGMNEHSQTWRRYAAAARQAPVTVKLGPDWGLEKEPAHRNP